MLSIVLGTSLPQTPRVGKTSFVSRYCRDEFHWDQQPKMLSVIPVDFEVQRVVTDDGIPLRLLFWDELCLRRLPFHQLVHSMRNKHALILVFDITDRSSFQELGGCLTAAREKQVLTTVLLGNKSDLSLERQVSYEEAQNFANAEKVPYFEVSLAEGSEGAEDVVNHVVFDLLGKLSLEAPPPPPGTPGTPGTPGSETPMHWCRIL